MEFCYLARRIWFALAAIQSHYLAVAILPLVLYDPWAHLTLRPMIDVLVVGGVAPVFQARRPASSTAIYRLNDHFLVSVCMKISELPLSVSTKVAQDNDTELVVESKQDLNYL